MLMAENKDIDIKKELDVSSSKKIFSNKQNRIEYLKQLEKETGKNFGLEESMSPTDLDKIIIQNWDYGKAKNIIRSMFKESEKYLHGKSANATMKIMIEEWKNKKLGELEWSFSQGGFDNFVQRINNNPNEEGEEKDETVKTSAVKFRRLKEINTLRNDFLETLIFEKNENIIPTLRA